MWQTDTERERGRESSSCKKSILCCTSGSQCGSQRCTITLQHLSVTHRDTHTHVQEKSQRRSRRKTPSSNWFKKTLTFKSLYVGSCCTVIAASCDSPSLGGFAPALGSHSVVDLWSRLRSSFFFPFSPLSRLFQSKKPPLTSSALPLRSPRH